MKKESITNYKNGFVYRANNKRVLCRQEEESDVFLLHFENYIGTDHLTSYSSNDRGVAVTGLKISKDTLIAICQGFMEHLQQEQTKK